MPYIAETRREFWKSPEASLKDATAGDLNYLISTLADEYLVENGLNYTNVNALVGAFECVKLELYRRVAAPYEDKKIEENGDVYQQY